MKKSREIPEMTLNRPFTGLWVERCGVFWASLKDRGQVSAYETCVWHRVAIQKSFIE